jgi:NADPH-dependent curcumin reductase CurA
MKAYVDNGHGGPQVESFADVPLLFGREAAGVADRIWRAAPQGIDAVFDQVGGQALEDVAPLLADRSKLISAGDRGTHAQGKAVIEVVK